MERRGRCGFGLGGLWVVLAVAAPVVAQAEPEETGAQQAEAQQTEAQQAEAQQAEAQQAESKGATRFLGFLRSPTASRASEQAESPEPGLDLPELEKPFELETRVGGALRFNLFFKTWPQPATIRDTGDNISFDTFRIDVESSYGPLRLSAQYRFYAGFNMLQHGFVGFQAAEVADIQLGVVRAPFGLLPYASHNWFFGLGYYVGLEDDHDVGVRVDFDLGVMDLQVAYFANDEGSYSGSSIDSARYSYDVVRSDGDEIPALEAVGGRAVEERHQGNLRATVTADHGELGGTEVGLSGQVGQLHNNTTGANGRHWAAAVHLLGKYGPVDVMLQASRYVYRQALPPEQDGRWVAMGAYDAPFRVAREAYLFSANLAYRLEVDWGPLESLTFYEDYSYLRKTIAGYADTQQSTTGMLLHAGPIYAYFDVVLGRNHPWIGPSYSDALAEGGEGAWEARLNANIGYYF
ncbi:MAG: hypothetical protein ACOC97_00800 [Myxococcota bacterium]